MSQTVLWAREGAVAMITLNRPHCLNSFNGEMHGALAAALERAATDATCRAVLLTGAGRGFCAGQDLADRAVTPGSARADLGDSLETLYNPLVRRMRDLPKPIIVAVNGVAAGAGANIALNGDIILAARSASFIQSFTKIGLMPDAGGTWLLTHRLGEARAKALTMLAEPLSAELAAQWGLIWKMVEDAALLQEALAIAQRLANGSEAALAATKHAIHAAATNALDQQLALELAGQRRLGSGPDYAEGVAAFVAKRAPNFGNRQ